ncbi:oligosaccharyl transferase alpha subunit [Rickenella mellea]|uniref:Dolichyl-diphosphooligosaccharide--protein glycosyltransferase subunit 1 n=1 Tax=Rickenella mellea TaxID=50990 RepID=A0A4R5XFE5_9AGAM|nr:oligosaccharyl transferase alpha subunit [Rickenella mellea]
MAVRWPLISFLFTSWAVLCHAKAYGSFENTAVVRTVELGGSLVHVKTTYAVKAVEDQSSVYTVAFGQEDHSKTSFLEARISGKQTPLKIEQSFGSGSNGDPYLYSVELPKPLSKDETTKLEVEIVQTHATYPWPAEVGQEDEQALKYETDLFVLSPYKTLEQRTKIRSPSPGILSYTTPEDVQDFTFEAPVTKSGATLTYGPFKNFPSSDSQHFVEKRQQRVTVHYKYDDPVMEVTELHRSAEISHWGANLNIQDEISLTNAGPKLKGQFSRLKHQQQTFYQKPSAHIIRGIVMHLPPGIRDTYFYDLIGNVSTSRLRTAPSIPKGSLARQQSVLELRPRYPLMGGWNYSFTLGWDAPLRDSASWDSKAGRYIVAVPIMTVLPGTVVDEATVKVILPEGAIDVEVFPPFPPKSMTRSTHTTYLDTTGRPAVTFEYSQLTDRHGGVIYLSYKVPFLAHLRKPFAVATAFFALFTVALAARRVDARIHKK